MKLLMVASKFPPEYGVGGFRVAKWAKYLPGCGVEPVVVTRRPRTTVNRRLAEQVQDVAQYRLPVPRGFGKFWWLGVLMVVLPALIVRERPASVLGTGSPFIPLLGVCAVSCVLGVPFVLDLRDPWALHPQHRERRTSLGQGLRDRCERWLVGRSAAVVVVTEEMAELYRRAYPQHGDKVVVVENGLDPDDAPAEKKVAREDDAFEFVYAGSFGSIRDPEPFFRAVAESPDGERAIRVTIIGRKEDRAVELVDEYGIDDSVVFEGAASYHDTLERLARADAGLVIGTYHPWEPTTKIFDYILVGLPVLAVTCKGGEVEKILRRCGGGRVVDGRNGDLSKAIRSFIACADRYRARMEECDVTEFSRERGAERLANLLRRVA